MIDKIKYFSFKFNKSVICEAMNIKKFSDCKKTKNKISIKDSWT